MHPHPALSVPEQTHPQGGARTKADPQRTKELHPKEMYLILPRMGVSCQELFLQSSVFLNARESKNPFPAFLLTFIVLMKNLEG